MKGELDPTKNRLRGEHSCTMMAASNALLCFLVRPLWGRSAERNIVASVEAVHACLATEAAEAAEAATGLTRTHGQG